MRTKHVAVGGSRPIFNSPPSEAKTVLGVDDAMAEATLSRCRR